MIGQANHARAELDVPGAFRCGGDEQLRGGNRFPSRTVVLAHPRFVESEVVEPLNEFQVPVERQGRIFAQGMKGSHENTEFHAFRKCHVEKSPSSSEISSGARRCHYTIKLRVYLVAHADLEVGVVVDLLLGIFTRL